MSAGAQIVCRVGYALNPKKLRQANAAFLESDDKEGSDKNSVDYGLQTGGSSAKSKSTREMPGFVSSTAPTFSAPFPNDHVTSKLWCGGGLATIVGIEGHTSGSGPDAGTLHRTAETSVVGGVAFAPLQAGGKFHVILHKLTEELDAHKCLRGPTKLDLLETYIAEHPSTVVIDPLTSVRNVVNRKRTCLCLQAIQKRMAEACPFGQPAFVVVEESSLMSGPNHLDAEMRSHGLSFPVICKPLEACGTANSHSMVIVFSPEGFADVKPPMIVQQFVDHDATFLKVYVIDSEVMYSTRRSLPNYQDTKNALVTSGTYVIPFDSRCPFPTLSDCGKIPGLSDKLPNTGTGSETGTGWRASSDLHSRIECAAQCISHEFGLTLFGFDIILPSTKEALDSETQMLVIDVNFFPSYKEVPDFPTKLRAYLRRAAGLRPWDGDE
jgi:hypothetical protein